MRAPVKHHCGNGDRPRGVTLLELLIALSIMAAVAGTLGVLGRAVQMGSEYGAARGLLTQHARVCLERITGAANGATANERFPGYVVVDEWVDGYCFADTLVVWRPSGTAQDPKGMPRLNELVVFCPHPADGKAGKLVEIRDDRTVALDSDPAQWRSTIAGIKSRAIQSNSSSDLTVLSDRLRTASAGGRMRGAVRFERRLRPSDLEWKGSDNWESAIVSGGYLAEAANGAAAERPAWAALSWVQDLRGNQAGLRQAHVRIELQLQSETEEGPEVIPFFGSATTSIVLARRQP